MCNGVNSADAEDYTAFQFIQLTFNDGAVSGDQQCYTVSITDDSVLENDETFSVTLTSGEPAFLGSSLTQATVTIRRDPADCEFVCEPPTHTFYCLNKVTCYGISILSLFLQPASC